MITRRGVDQQTRELTQWWFNAGLTSNKHWDNISVFMTLIGVTCLTFNCEDLGSNSVFWHCSTFILPTFDYLILLYIGFHMWQCLMRVAESYGDFTGNLKHNRRHGDFADDVYTCTTVPGDMVILQVTCILVPLYQETW